MARGGSSKGGGDRLAHFVHQQRLKDFISNELREVTSSPLKFIAPNGSVAHGYEADEYLAKLCFAVLDADRAGGLQQQQAHIAAQCRILIEGFSIVGINALVDEATGYQELRERDALRKILERYITDEWAKWTRRFPAEFYRQVFRLKDIPFPPTDGRTPSYVGHWTNDIVYSRLAPGILDKLRELVPRKPAGSRARKFHQHLTEDVGVPELQQHLSNLIFLMKGCRTWEEFKQRLDIAAPKFGDTMRLAL